jgi:hypothetical protein
MSVVLPEILKTLTPPGMHGDVRAVLEQLYAEFQAAGAPAGRPYLSAPELLIDAQENGGLEAAVIAMGGMEAQASGSKKRASEGVTLTGGGRRKTARRGRKRTRRGRKQTRGTKSTPAEPEQELDGGVRVAYYSNDKGANKDDDGSGSDVESDSQSISSAASGASASSDDSIKDPEVAKAFRTMSTVSKTRMLDSMRSLGAANRILQMLHSGYDVELRPRIDADERKDDRDTSRKPRIRIGGARHSNTDVPVAFETLSATQLRDDLNWGLEPAVMLLRQEYPRTLGRLPSDVVQHAVRSALNLRYLNVQRRQRMQEFRYARVALLDKDPFKALCNTEMGREVAWKAFHVPGDAALDALMKISDIIIQASGRLPEAFETAVVWDPESFEDIYNAIMEAKGSAGAQVLEETAAETALYAVWTALRLKAFDDLADAAGSGSGLGLGDAWHGVGSGPVSDDAGLALSGASGLGVLSKRSLVEPLGTSSRRDENTAAVIWNSVCIQSDNGERIAPNGRDPLVADVEALVARQLRAEGLSFAAEMVETRHVLRHLRLVESETRPQLFYNWMAAEEAFAGRYPHMKKPLPDDFRGYDEEFRHAANIKDAYDLFTGRRRYLRLMLQFGANLAQDVSIAKRLENQVSSLMLSMASSLVDTMVDMEAMRGSVADTAVKLAKDLRLACSSNASGTVTKCVFPREFPVAKSFAGDADDIIASLQGLLQCGLTNAVPQYKDRVN